MTPLVFDTHSGVLPGSLLIADKEPLFLDYLTDFIGEYIPGSIVSRATTFDALISELEGDSPADLAFMDLSMPGLRGLYGILFLAQRYPNVRLVVISEDESRDHVERCLLLGAHAVLSRKSSVATVAAAIKAIHAGESWPFSVNPVPELCRGEAASADADRARLKKFRTFTPREIYTYMHLCDGKEDKEIARELNVAPSTAKAHVASILAKLGVKNRTQAVIAAYQSGLEIPVTPVPRS